MPSQLDDLFVLGEVYSINQWVVSLDDSLGLQENYEHNFHDVYYHEPLYLDEGFNGLTSNYSLEDNINFQESWRHEKEGDISDTLIFIESLHKGDAESIGEILGFYDTFVGQQATVLGDTISFLDSYFLNQTLNLALSDNFTLTEDRKFTWLNSLVLDPEAAPGPTQLICTITGNVITVPGGTDLTQYYHSNGFITLSGLSGGSGPTIVNAQIASVTSTTITLTRAVTSHTAGNLAAPFIPVTPEPQGVSITPKVLGAKVILLGSSLELPTPIFGDKDSYALNRVERTARNSNHLIIFREDFWPIKRRLTLTFEYLNQKQFDGLKEFTRTHVGVPVTYTDHLQRTFNVIIDTPNHKGIDEGINFGHKVELGLFILS